MSEFHFLRPLWFLALPLVIGAAWALWRARGRGGSWEAVCDPHLLAFLLVGGSDEPRRRLAPWWLGIVGTLLIGALAGPAWERLPQPVFRDQSALIIALDLSRSMDAGDVKPSRLTRAKQKITDILRNRQTGQTGLLVYAGEAFVVTPLSDDTETIRSQLASLDTGIMPVQGSRADLALAKALALLQQAGATRGQVLLVTDGIETRKFAAQLDALRNHGFRVSILGVGTPQGAPIALPGGGFLKDDAGAIVIPTLDAAALTQWAQRSGGRYAELRADDADLRYLLADSLTQPMDQAKQAQGLTTDQWREQGPWLILLVLPLIALVFRRGVLLMLPLLLIPLPGPAQAMGWSDLWARPDQQAMTALKQGDAVGAAGRFEDPQWKAAANYRAGHYQQAADLLASIDRADAQYNRGNALAKLGHYPEAMTAYQRALQLNPAHADAKHNLELLQQLQPPQDSQSSGKGNKKSEGKQGKASSRNKKGQGNNQQAGATSEQDQQSMDRQAQQAGEQQGSKDNTDEATGEPKNAARKPQQQATSPEDSAAKASTDNGKQQHPSQAQPTAPEAQAKADQAAATAELEDAQHADSTAEQWLRRIPDDPGGLLRRKFRYQYQQRNTQSTPEGPPW